MSDENAFAGAALDEQLVAYLDGELDAASRRRVEDLLSSDAGVRLRLQEMERTWELLDELDAAPAGAQFTQSTLEMVAVAADADVQQSLADAPRRRRRRWLTVGGGLLVAAAAGFLTVAWLRPDPNRQLVADLPVLENLDRYRQVDDFEFLNMLLASGLFPPEAGEETAEAAAPADESPAERRRRIAGMSLEEQERLAQLQQRFADLDEDQRRRLRALHEALRQSPNADALRQTMQRYCEWLSALPSYTRGELVELPPAERMAMVERLQREQAREAGRRLARRDAAALAAWMSERIRSHESQLLELLSQSRRKELAELASPERRRWMLFLALMQRWQESGTDRPPPLMSDDDLPSLRKRLGDAAREQLEARPTADQWRQVADWLRRQRPVRGFAPRPDDQRLADFFENELSDEERNWLLNMPGEEMQRKLWQLYLTRARSGQQRPEHGPKPEQKRDPPYPRFHRE